MTWAEFKTAVEASGVTDDDEIWYIDVSTMDTLPDNIVVHEDEHLGYAIRD